MDINHVHFKGRVGKDDASLVVRQNPNNGFEFLSLSLSMAINGRKFMTAKGLTQKTLWINVVQTFNKMKDGNYPPIAYQIRDALKSGEPVQVQGELEMRDYVTQEGVKKTRFEVNTTGINNWIMLKDLPRAVQAQPVNQAQPVAQATQPVQQAQPPVAPAGQAQAQQAQPQQAQPPVVDVSHLEEDLAQF